MKTPCNFIILLRKMPDINNIRKIPVHFLLSSSIVFFSMIRKGKLMKCLRRRIPWEKGCRYKRVCKMSSCSTLSIYTPYHLCSQFTLYFSEEDNQIYTWAQEFPNINEKSMDSQQLETKLGENLSVCCGVDNQSI